MNEKERAKVYETIPPTIVATIAGIRYMLCNGRLQIFPGMER